MQTTFGDVRTADVLRRGSVKGFAKVDSILHDWMKYERKLSNKIKASLATAGEECASVAHIADETADKMEAKAKNALPDTRNKIVIATNRADSAVDKYLSDASEPLAKFPAKGTRISKLLDHKVVAAVEPFGITYVKLLRYVTSTWATSAEKNFS